jgi:hypothetical protein
MISYLSFLFQSFPRKVLCLLVLSGQVSAEIGDPISCVGGLWSTLIGIYPAVPLHSHEVCTRVLDDRGIDRGLGGMCGPADHQGRSSVMFSRFPDVGEAELLNGATWTSSQEVPLWVALFCRDYCWCNTDIGGDLQIKPKGYPAQSSTYLEPLQRIYEFDLGENPRFESSKNRGALRSSSRSIALRTYIQRFKYTPLSGSSEFRKTLLPGIPVALDPLNIIKCNQVPLPDFPNMPPPYTMADFRSPIELCATALSGGNP